MKLQLLKEPRELKSWIDVEGTIEKLGYDPRLFKPSSSRIVLTVCEDCKQSRDCRLGMAELHPLCLTCSNRKNARSLPSRKKRSELMKVRSLDPTYKHPTKGVGHTEKAKERIRVNRKPAVYSPEIRAKLSCNNLGVKNPFYGRQHSLESRKKMSEVKRITTRRGKECNFYGQVQHGKGSWINCSQGKIWVRSSYEAAVVRYLDDKGFDWKFEPQAFSITYEREGELVCGTYRPDFYVEELGKYLEVKGYWRDDARAKFEAFKRGYPDLFIEVWDTKILKEKGIYERYGTLLRIK